MTRLPRIALLVCDKPLPQVITKYGDYPTMFTNLLRASLPTSVSSTIETDAILLDAYDVRDAQDYPDENEYDALMLSGSSASAYEDAHWIHRLTSYITLVATTRPEIKLIGICFGHQIIAQALGGECVSNTAHGWEVGLSHVTLTPLGRRIFLDDDETKEGAEVLTINQMHRDIVPELPASSRWPFELLGSTPGCAIQGMALFEDGSNQDLSKIRILTVQGHPEFNGGTINEIVNVRRATGVIPEPTADAALSLIDGKESRNYRVGRAIWRVLGVM